MAKELNAEQRNAWTVAYKLFEKYADTPDTDEKWIALAEEVGIIYEQSDKSHLISHLLMAVMDTFNDETLDARKAAEEANKPTQPEPEQLSFINNRW